MNKMWKSDGDEQQLLEKLFQEKKVNPSMKPSAVQKEYPTFHGFTSAVFRKHWNNTKHKFDGSIVGKSSNDCEIIEIDGESPAKKQKTTSDLSEITSATVEYKQPPIISSIYSDPETKQQKCLIVVLLFSNIKNIEFDVIEGPQDQTLIITYEWPKTSFNVSEMFKKEGASQTFINKMHPKYLATEMALQHVRDNFEEAPVGTIEVKLPVSVQTEPSTWTKYFNKKKDGTLLVFFEFQCLRKDYIISKSEKSLCFE